MKMSGPGFCATVRSAPTMPATRNSPRNTLQQLETMAGSTRSTVVQSSYHGAAGTLLMNKQNVPEAIGHLEEDEDNPYSLELLSRAYATTGASDKRHEVEVKLRASNAPTMEQALVVPAAARDGRTASRRS